MRRDICLDEAKKCVCEDRNNQYGEPEDNFKIIADYWDLYLKSKKYIHGDSRISSDDVAIMMALFKIARMANKQNKVDTFVDAIGYLACGCEIASNG